MDCFNRVDTLLPDLCELYNELAPLPDKIQKTLRDIEFVIDDLRSLEHDENNS